MFAITPVLVYCAAAAYRFLEKSRSCALVAVRHGDAAARDDGGESPSPTPHIE